MKILVTGGGGFVGRHLSTFLSMKKNIEVHALNRRDCDMTEAGSVMDLVEKIRPDRIFHLAAQSSVPESWKFPVETMKTNIMGQVHLLEAVRRIGLSCPILISGSSEEYGIVSADCMPVNENQPLKPLSPYGISKVAQDLIGGQYFQTYNLPIVRTRAFSHTGPGQREEYVASNFARQIARMEAGELEPVLRVGNLDAMRDFTDVRDVVRAYWSALENGKPGEVYNICSGTGRKIQEIVDTLVSSSRVKIGIQKDPKRMRASDIPMIIGDGSKFKAQTGWIPEMNFQKTLEDLLNHWREKIACLKSSN